LDLSSQAFALTQFNSIFNLIYYHKYNQICYISALK
jgi:hypothetical protein